MKNTDSLGNWKVVALVVGTLMLSGCGGTNESAPGASVSNTTTPSSPATPNQPAVAAYQLSGTLSGANLLQANQTLTVLVNGTVVTTLTSSSSSSLNLGTVAATSAGAPYNVTLQGGWSASQTTLTTSTPSTTDGTYCYVEHGSGIATESVSNINIQCQAGPPSVITLSGSQNGVSYTGQTLAHPIVVNGELFYLMMSGSSPLSIAMQQSATETSGQDLATLFDGPVPQGQTMVPMNASGDPSTVTPGYSSNLTTLQAVLPGGAVTVAVAIPTSTQWEKICPNGGNALANCTVAPYWGSGASQFWSSTVGGPGHGTQVLTVYGPVFESDNIVVNVAVQVL